MQNLTNFYPNDGDSIFVSKRRKTSHFCSRLKKFVFFKLNGLESFKLEIFRFAGIPVPWH
jgi:hypothetical protein